MAETWRILKEKHAITAFTGEGAAKSGGRWNSRGVLLVYTSGTKSLLVCGLFRLRNTAYD